MDFSQVDGILHIHLDNFFILGIACLCYFLGRWIKSEIKLLQDLSIPVPFIGGLPAAIVFACLKISKTAVVVLNPDLNALIFQFFLTMMALMGSWKLIKTGFVISIMFWSFAMVLGVLQALIGLTAAQALGMHQHLGLLMGTISMMGGTETLSSFIPAVEQLDKFSGAAEAALGVATLGMVSLKDTILKIPAAPNSTMHGLFVPFSEALNLFTEPIRLNASRSLLSASYVWPSDI